MKTLMFEIRKQASPYNLTMATLGSLIVLPILIILFSTLEFVYYKATPADWNVKYHAVIPQKSIFMKDEVLTFLSDRTTYHEANLSFNDSLFCDVYEDRQFGLVGSPVFAHNRIVQVSERATFPWSLNIEIPKNAERCYLRSQITDNRPYGISKTQEVVGRTFRVNGVE